MSKVFVGNFSFAVDEDKLREYFARIGNVMSAKVMREGPEGRSRGFGFVEFADADAARSAITQLDGSVWEGRVIKVSEDLSNRRGGGDHHHRSSSDSEEGGYHRNNQPMGYFRAQPLDLGIRKKRKSDPFEEDESLAIDYKDARMLSRYLSERGRILPRRMTGLNAFHQRQVSRAIKRAQFLALLSPTQKLGS